MYPAASNHDVHPEQVLTMSTSALRHHFLFDTFFVFDKVSQVSARFGKFIIETFDVKITDICPMMSTVVYVDGGILAAIGRPSNEA